MKLRKLVAALMAMLLLCTIIPFSAVAASDSATITFDDVSKRVELSTGTQVWEENGITVINNKDDSSSNVADYVKPARFYKGSTLIVEYPGMTKIEFMCNTASYAKALKDAIGSDATAQDKVVTVVLKGEDAFSCALSAGQVRLDAITVYAGESGGDTPVTPEPPVVGDPEADTELSIVDAIALGLSKEHNTYTSDKYYVTGVITEVYNTQYGNMRLTDEAGNILTIYGTYSEDGQIRYDGLDNPPVAGDTVTIYGVIGQYNDVAQMKNGWIVGVTNDEPAPDVAYPMGYDAYIDFTDVGNRVSYSAEQQVWEQNGILVTNDKGASTSNVGNYSAPARFYKGSTVTIEYPGMSELVIECWEMEDKYIPGWIDSINDDNVIYAEISEDLVHIMFAQPVDSFTWEELTAQVRARYIFVYAGEGGDTPVDPPVDSDEYPDYMDITVPYVLGLTQYNVSEEDLYFLDGGMNGYYMSTTTDLDMAILLYLEPTKGGYYLYTDDGVTKRYINMVVSGTHVNGVYQSTPSTVYNHDQDLWTLVTEVNGELYVFGTRSDKNYTTLGPVKVDNDPFIAVLYMLVDECEHEYECSVIEPTCGEVGEEFYECVLCGDYYFELIPATGEHTYDDDADTDCNVCGQIREIIDFAGSIVVSTTQATAGSTVSVTVSLPNNPGIVSAKVKVFYDKSILNLVSYEMGNFSASGYSWGNPAKDYFIINWCDSINPNSTADLLATLTFRVLEDAPEGFTAITLEFSCEDDMFDSAEETVYFEAVNGGVEIVTDSCVPGDVNDDGRINNRDLGLMQQYLNEWDVTLNEGAADVNGDGRINNRDLGALQLLLNE